MRIILLLTCLSVALLVGAKGIMCPRLAEETISGIKYLVSDASYTWNDARDICHRCAGTSLADIPSAVIFASLNEETNNFWIGSYDGGSKVDNLVWEWGAHPWVSAFAPSNLKRRFICDGYTKNMSRCTYSMMGTMVGTIEELPLTTPQNTSRSRCFTTKVLNAKGETIDGASIKLCISDIRTTDSGCPFVINHVITISTPLGSFTLIRPVTHSPLFYMSDTGNLFTHIIGSIEEILDSTGYNWGIRGELGTGKFSKVTGRVRILGFINFEKLYRLNELGVDFTVTVDWEKEVLCN